MKRKSLLHEYDVIIDDAAIVSEDVYSPAVASVILNPVIVEILDSFVISHKKPK